MEQKSGTTWLHACLRKSAHIFGPTPKELNFFNRPSLESRLKAYANCFPKKPGATYYMESTPHYFQLPREGHDIAVSIKRHLGNPKIIVVFRNPIDRYESAMIHHMMKGRFPYSATIETHPMKLNRQAHNHIEVSKDIVALGIIRRSKKRADRKPSSKKEHKQ